MPIINLKPSKPMPKFLEEVYDLLRYTSEDIQFRWSRRGVPHIIISMPNGDYSVCYFGKHKSYRVFFPYTSQGQEQIKWDSKDAKDVVEYIESQVPKNRKLHSDGSVEEGDYYNRQTSEGVDEYELSMSKERREAGEL